MPPLLWPTGCVAIVDSGNAGISVPGVIYDHVLKEVTKNHNCDGTMCKNCRLDQFPTFTLTAPTGEGGDSSFTLQPVNYILFTSANHDGGDCQVRRDAKPRGKPRTPPEGHRATIPPPISSPSLTRLCTRPLLSLPPPHPPPAPPSLHPPLHSSCSM
jgi:hypothetical protein